MQDNIELYLTLMLSKLSLGKQKQIIDRFMDLDSLRKVTAYNGDISKILDGQEYQAIRQTILSGAVNTHLQEISKRNIGVISIDSVEYPENLRNIHEPPLVLYFCGDISLLKTDCIAVVGTRHLTRYGSEQATRFAKDLAKADFTIVSGLADGIDTYAHKGALEVNGKTIAVLAGGLYTIYPAINTNLAREISEKGLLISENLPDFLPKGYAFVQRNRIIAGLSLGVFVPEMGAKSGAIHTLNYANEEGRYIFALPGNVNSNASVGTNKLIRNLQGACVLEPNDIIKNFSGHNEQKVQKSLNRYNQLDIFEKMIYDIVKIQETHFDELLQKTQLEPKKLLSMLTTMEIRGLIKKLAGNFYTV